MYIIGEYKLSYNVLFFPNSFVGLNFSNKKLEKEGIEGMLQLQVYSHIL